MTFSRLADQIHFMEATYSLEKLRDMARKVGVSASGTKREIIERIVVKKGEDWKPPAVPMAGRRQHQYGDRRTVFYIQYWSPKSDPENSQPYYYSGPEEGGTYKDLNQALRAASELQQARPDVFDISIYSQVEEWIAETEDPRYGYWEIVEGTIKGYDMRGALVYDETSPDFGSVPMVDNDKLFSGRHRPLPPSAY